MEQSIRLENRALLVMDIQKATVKMLPDSMPLIHNKSFWAMKSNPAMFFDSEESFRILPSVTPLR